MTPSIEGILSAGLMVTQPFQGANLDLEDLSSTNPERALGTALSLCIASEGNADFVNKHLDQAGYKRGVRIWFGGKQ